MRKQIHPVYHNIILFQILRAFRCAVRYRISYAQGWLICGNHGKPIPLDDELKKILARHLSEKDREKIQAEVYDSSTD